LSTEPQTIAPAGRPPGGQPPLGDQSLAELMRRLSDQSTLLVRQELDLAKAELAEKGKQAGIGAGMFGGTAVFGLYAVGALTATLILALSLAVAGWLAALIVTVLYAAIAGVLALVGKSRVTEAVPPVPEQTVETVKEDVQWAKSQLPSGSR
jgi:uncharacterized membrane protein YqjE